MRSVPSIALISLAAMATNAHACDPAGPHVLVEVADRIALGEVEVVTKARSRPERKAHVRVVRMLKGAAPSKFVYEFSSVADQCGLTALAVRSGEQLVFLLDGYKQPSAHFAMRLADYQRIAAGSK